MREDEVAHLRTLAATDPAVLDRMLMSTDEFCDVDASNLTVELRRDLLDRLGMYGVRVSLRGVGERCHHGGRARTASWSSGQGSTSCRRLIAEHFMPRSRVLKARTAVQALRVLAATMRQANPEGAVKLDREVEQVEAGAVEFARMRGAHLVSTGEARVAERERAELERLLLAATPAGAVGLGPRRRTRGHQAQGARGRRQVA